MNTKGATAIRIITSVLVAWALAWLLLNVNAYGDRITAKGTASLLQVQTHKLNEANRRSISEGGGGLDLIEYFECMCGQPDYGIGGWVGLWFVTALIGGVPTAVLLRHRR